MRHSTLIRWILALTILGPSAARAVIPEPDNVLHGRIQVGTNQVTAAQDNVVVELFRQTGEFVVGYRMGQNPAFGDNYVIDIPLESGGAPLGGAASVFGNELLVLVKEYPSPFTTNFVEHHRATYSVGDRGHVEQMDFGVTMETPFTEYEIWEMAWHLPAGSGMLDADGDGDSNEDEYVAGTDPLDPDDRFELIIQVPSPGAGVEVSWWARLAEGPGYEGITRHYALETVTDLTSVTWNDIPGFTNVLGGDQTESYLGSPTNAPSFYRGRVWLEP